MQQLSNSCPAGQDHYRTRYTISHSRHFWGLSTRAVAIASATLLIGASAGFGAFYAGALGAEHGPVLALLGICMAIGLELAKPFSFAAAFDAWHNLRIAQGLAVALMGLVAVGYSLSAELSLMASLRSDKVAERAAASNVASNARERHRRARVELDRLPAARPIAELQSLIDGVLIDPRAGGCVVVDGPFTREHCPKVAEWRAEQGRAQRRRQLETKMHKAEAAMEGGPVARTADPGAAALATYLAIFGVRVEPALLTEMLILVSVLALELGSALSIVLVQAVSGSAPAHPARARHQTLNSVPGPAPLVQVAHSHNTEDATARERVKGAILDQLGKRGGSLAKSERGLAALIGTSRPTVRRAINGLVVAGLVAAAASRNGTVLRLVG